MPEIVSPIPEEAATRLCAEIAAQNRAKWYTFNGLWCWGCVTFTGGDPAKRCFYHPPDFRGCAQVNKRYEQLEKS